METWFAVLLLGIAIAVLARWAINDARAGDDMPLIRAELLSCFLHPRPTSLRDLQDRAISIDRAARALCRLDPWANDAEFSSEHYEMLNHRRAALQAEAEVMLEAGFLSQPRPDDAEHEPPPGVYVLTKVGAMAAMAVLEVAEAAERGS